MSDLQKTKRAESKKIPEQYGHNIDGDGLKAGVIELGQSGQ